MRPPPPPTSFLHASRLPFSPSADDDSSIGGVEDRLRAGPSRPSQPAFPNHASASTPSGPAQHQHMQYAPPPQSYTPVMQTPQHHGVFAAPPQLVRGPSIAPPITNAPRFAPAPLPAPNLFSHPNPSRAGLASPDSTTGEPSFSFGPMMQHPRPPPVRPGLWSAMAPPPPPNPPQLEAAALAAERRIQHLRATAAARTPDPNLMGPARRVVSFSTATPQNYRAAPAVTPAPPTRAAGAVRNADGSVSHLIHRGESGGYEEQDLSFSLSPPTVPAAPTRLFAATNPTSTGRGEQSFASEAPSTSLSATLPPEHEIQKVTLRKWDGSTACVPAYLVSDTPEQAVEEVFEYNTVTLFDVPSLLSRHSSAVSGSSTPQTSEKDQDDALKGILEVQLGLKGAHGWYGHTYKNPKRANAREGKAGGRGSLKRRRSDEDQHSEEEDEDEDEDGESAPIVVYDTFGRVKGTITLPDYSTRGGPSFPLPPPAETFALRSAAGAAIVLKEGSKLQGKEERLSAEIDLVKQRYDDLQGKTPGRSTVRSAAFYRELASRRSALTSFRQKHRSSHKKGLQNALLDSILLQN